MEKVNYKLFPRQVFKQAAAASAKSLPSCPTRCDRIDGSPPGSPIPGNLQARILEWVAISFSNLVVNKLVVLKMHMQKEPVLQFPRERNFHFNQFSPESKEYQGHPLSKSYLPFL